MDIKNKMLSSEDSIVVSEKLAFTIIIENEHFIVINFDEFEKLDETMRKITIYHELAHATGILDEDEADEFVKDYLEDDEFNILEYMRDVDD